MRCQPAGPEPAPAEDEEPESAPAHAAARQGRICTWGYERVRAASAAAGLLPHANAMQPESSFLGGPRTLVTRQYDPWQVQAACS